MCTKRTRNTTCLAFELAHHTTHADRLRRGCDSDAVRSKRASRRLAACAARLAEAEIVVGAHVDQSELTAGELQVPVLVVRVALEQCELGAGSASHRPIHTIAQPAVDVALVVLLESIVERDE